MNEVWVLSVKTSLPNVCSGSGDLSVTFKAFDSFEKGRDAMRAVVKKLAFSKNSMFDGAGHITYFLDYVEDFKGENDDDDEGDWLGAKTLNYVIDCLREAFAGKDVDFELENGFYTDWMIAVNVSDEEIFVCGDADGPCNGYNPDIRTNMFSMKENKDYYLYIDDGFGQDDCTSELYIDLKKATLN